MAIENPLFLQKTAVDLVVTYTDATIQSPIPLYQGTGISSIMDIDISSGIEYERTVTGDVSVAVLPVSVTGKMHLHPQSPAIQALTARISKYFQTPPIIIPGIIAVSSVAANFSYSFTNVVWDAPFAGYNIGKVLEDYVWNFKAIPPNLTSVSNLINSAAGAVNLI